MKVFTFTLSLTDYHHDLECLLLRPSNLSVQGAGGGRPRLSYCHPPYFTTEGGGDFPLFPTNLYASAQVCVAGSGLVSDSTPGCKPDQSYTRIAMVCFNNSFLRPPLEFQGQIDSLNTFQVPVLLFIQTFSLQNLIGRLKGLTNIKS